MKIDSNAIISGSLVLSLMEQMELTRDEFSEVSQSTPRTINAYTREERHMPATKLENIVNRYNSSPRTNKIVLLNNGGQPNTPLYVVSSNSVRSVRIVNDNLIVKYLTIDYEQRSFKVSERVVPLEANKQASITLQRWLSNKSEEITPTYSAVNIPTSKKSLIMKENPEALPTLYGAFAGAHYAISEFKNVIGNANSPNAKRIISNAESIIFKLDALFKSKGVEVIPFINCGNGKISKAQAPVDLGDVFFHIPFGGGIAFVDNFKNEYHISDNARFIAGRFDDAAFDYFEPEIDKAILESQ